MAEKKKEIHDNQTTPVEPEKEEETLPVEKRSRKTLILFGVVAALLLLVIGAGVFVYSLQNKPKTPVLVNVSPTAQPSLTPDTGIPADWKTFESEDFAYTFSYPPEDFKLEEGESVRVVYLGPTQTEGTEVFDGIIVAFDPVIPLGNQLLLPYVKEDLGKQREHVEVIKEPTKIEVNGIEGYTYTVSGLGEFTFIYLPAPDGKNVVRINYLVADPENSGYQQIVDDILESFSFTSS